MRDVAVNARFLLPRGQLEGLGRYTREVTRHLADSHPDVTFHLLFDRPFDAKYVDRPNLQPHVLSPPARHPVLFLWWFEVSVASWLAKHRPDVFFSPDGFTTLRTRVPRVTVVHDLAFEHYPRDIHLSQRAYYRSMMPRFVARSASIVTVSEASRSDLIDTYSTPESKVAVAYPGVDAAFQQPADAPAIAAARSRFAAGADYFMFVGAIQPRKNVPALLRAFDAFKTATSSRTRLLLVGRQAWRTEATRRALDQLSHRDDVVLTGPVSDTDLRALYSGSVATVFVSQFEGFGLPVTEAMSCGSPVITSNLSSMPEAAGGAALLVDPADRDELTRAMTQLDADSELRSRLSDRGRDHARSFRWESTAQAVWDELERAAARTA